MNFHRSFRISHVLRSEDVCSLKKHFTGATREVVGILDIWATNDPERFVWCGVDAIVARCHRYKAHAYTKPTVEKVLAFLRSEHIISRRVKRERRVGAYIREVDGFIMTPHDALAIRTKNVCKFVGATRAPGAWEATAGVPGIWWVQSKRRSGQEGGE